MGLGGVGGHEHCHHRLQLECYVDRCILLRHLRFQDADIVFAYEKALQANVWVYGSYDAAKAVWQKHLKNAQLMVRVLGDGMGGAAAKELSYARTTIKLARRHMSIIDEAVKKDVPLRPDARWSLFMWPGHTKEMYAELDGKMTEFWELDMDSEDDALRQVFCEAEAAGASDEDEEEEAAGMERETTEGLQ